MFSLLLLRQEQLGKRFLSRLLSCSSVYFNAMLFSPRYTDSLMIPWIRDFCEPGAAGCPS